MAFCSDYFKEVYKRFPNSMDRVEKTTLLLNLADHSEIISCLREEFGNRMDTLLTPTNAAKRAKLSMRSKSLVRAKPSKRREEVKNDIDDRARRAIGQTLLSNLSKILITSPAILEATLPYGKTAQIKINQDLIQDASYIRQLSFIFEMLDKLEERIQFLEKQKTLPYGIFVDFEPELRERRCQTVKQYTDLKEILSAIILQTKIIS